MKQLILVLITFFYFSSIKAQDNPYKIFGYESKVKYESKISEYLIIKNTDTTSLIKSIAFNTDENFILFLNKNDSIIHKKKLNQVIYFAG